MNTIITSTFLNYRGKLNTVWYYSLIILISEARFIVVESNWFQEIYLVLFIHWRVDLFDCIRYSISI